jgi:hypothetical protein
VAKPAKTRPSKTRVAAEPVVPKAAHVTVPSGNWRIQLGAFSQRGSAEALYQRLSAKAVLAGRNPFYIAAGNVTRLQVGPFATRAAAAAACGSLGAACFPVPAK